MKAKTICGTFLKSVGILALSTALGLLLLIGIYLIPVNEGNANSSFRFFDKMGWSPRVSFRYENYISHFDTFESDVLDDGTDKIILTYVLDDTGNIGLKKAVNMFDYGRYWHGYVVLLRPVFFLIDYWDFTLANGMLQISLVLLLALLVWKETSLLRYPLAVLSSYLLLMPASLANCLQFSPVFYLAFLGSIAAVCLKDFLGRGDHLYLFFLVMGILTCYFTLLTNPLLTWAFPLCWYLALKKDGSGAVKQLTDTVITAVCWTAGFVGMYFTKWILLFAVCGPEAFRESDTAQAFSYIGLVPDEYKVIKQTYNRFDVLYTNWRHYLFPAFLLILTIWLLWSIYTRIRCGWSIRGESAPFLLVSFSAPAWYLFFSSHTTIHHFFTFRTFAASILAVLLFLSGCVRTEKKAERRKLNAKPMILFALCLCAGWGLSFLARENVLSSNSDSPYDTVTLAPGSLFETSFIPTFGDIRNFGLGAKALKDTDGTVHAEICDDASLIYELDLPVDAFQEKTFFDHYVEWKLRPGRQYRMTLSLRENTSGISLLLTKDGQLPLNEYRNSRLDDSSLGSVQLLSALVYNETVLSKKTRLFLIFVTAFYLWLLSETAFTVLLPSMRRRNSG